MMKQNINVKSTLIVLVVLLIIPALQATGFQTVAYTNVTIETVAEQGRLENATLVIKDGMIEDVGTKVKIPDDARVISLDGATIMPGIIDPYLVFKRSPTTETTRTVTFGGRTFTIPTQQGFSVGSFDTVSEYFYPYQNNFVPNLRCGVTTANLVSDGRGLSALAHLTKDPDENMLFEKNAILFALVTNQTSALDVIRNGLDENKTTTASRGSRSASSASRNSNATNEVSSNGASSNGASTESSGTSQKELWSEVRDGKKPLIVNANNAATVAHLLKILEKHEKVKLCLVSTGPNIFESLDELKARKVEVILQPTIETVPFNSQRINVPRMIAENEIPFAFSMSLNSTQMNGSLDDPMFPLSVLVKTGLDRDAALSALTLAPAKMLGIDKTHGSIEKGKTANLLIFGGDPLATQSQLRQVIVKGKTIHEN